MIGRRSSRLRPVHTAIVILVQLIASAPAWADDSGTFDCGTLSLYTLLRLAGKPTDLARISSHLPKPSSAGPSMQELRDAARDLGLELTGVKLPDSGRFEVDHAIVHLDRGDHGHFVVVRPVGHTGKVVQVFDSVRDPIAVEIDDLRKTPDWTGLALVPIRRNRLAYSIGAAIIAISTPLVVLLLTRTMLGRRLPA